MEKNKFWNIKADDAKKKCHIDLFGYVGGSKEWNDGFNEKDFLDEFRAIPSDSALDISVNSFGGSVYTALSIYSLLKSHKGEITIRVDGAAMSAATIITSVPNAHVIIPQGAMMMIHNISSAVEGNADEMRKFADDMEKLENNVIDIYAAKTKKKCEEIREFVNAETFFTASEAVAFGLADELDESTKVENVADGDFVSLNGLRVKADLIPHLHAAHIKAESPKASAEQNPVKEAKPMTLETLKAEHPELVEAIRKEALSEGAMNERARIQAIEDVAVEGHEDLVQSAKFGEVVMSAEQLAVAILKADKQNKARMLAKRAQDAEDLAMLEEIGNLGVMPNNEQRAKDEAELQAVIAAGKRGFNNK